MKPMNHELLDRQIYQRAGKIMKEQARINRMNSCDIGAAADVSEETVRKALNGDGFSFKSFSRICRALEIPPKFISDFF